MLFMDLWGSAVFSLVARPVLCEDREVPRGIDCDFNRCYVLGTIRAPQTHRQNDNAWST
jgi:hypothetical protein